MVEVLTNEMDLLKRNFAANQSILTFLQDENASLQKQLAEAKSEKSVGSRVVHEKDDTQPSQTPLQAVKNAHRAHCAQLQELRNKGKEQSQPEVNAAAPQLKGHKNEVKTRLGNDVKVGKRKGKNGNKDANTDEKVQCRKSISKFLEREAVSSCSQNSTDCDSSTDTSTKKSPDAHSSAFSRGEEVFVSKSAEKRLKLAKAIFVGPDDESDKAGMYSLLQLNTKYIKEDEEIPLPAETVDGDLTLNEVQDNEKKEPAFLSGEEEKRAELKTPEEWVAVSYGRDLRYIGRVVKEDKRAIRIQFLEKKADGFFQLKKRDEETEKDIVFMRNVDVQWKGIGRYEVLREKEIRKKHEEFWKTLRLKKKVESYWNINAHSDLSEVVCRVGVDEILVGDFKTIQPSMSAEEIEMMKKFSLRFREVGWLNDKVVNASLKLLEVSSRKMGIKVFAAESFVIEKIRTSEELSQLKSWKWMKKIDFSNQDLVLLPMCHASHWTLGVVNVKQKELLHYDSKSEKQGKSTTSGELFFSCMRKIMAADNMDVPSWKNISPTTPQQCDGQSCGVYVIKVAEFVVEEKKPFISQDEVNNLRLQIALNLLKNSR